MIQILKLQLTSIVFAIGVWSIFMVGMTPTASCEEPNTSPQIDYQVRSLQIGGATVDVVSRCVARADSPRWLLCNLHDDENTSVEAALAVLPKYQVRLVELKHTGQREILFRLQDVPFRCDPNRIFTPAGVTATLSKLSTWTAAADHEVAALGRQLIKLYQLAQVEAVVALHNNTPERYGANSYAPGQEYAADAAAVHLVPGSDLDDFFFVTDRKIYQALVEQEFNVVLQNNATVTDDGSLSVYCGQHRIPYVNVEAQHEHLRQQIDMLTSLFAVLDKLSFEARAKVESSP